MAWVHLSDLFHKERNFYGLLPIDAEVEIKINDKFDFTEQFKKHFAELYEGKKLPISELVKDEYINQPEWLMDTNGVLYQFGMYEVDGEIRCFKTMTIDFLSHIKKLPEKHQRAIWKFNSSNARTKDRKEH